VGSPYLFHVSIRIHPWSWIRDMKNEKMEEASVSECLIAGRSIPQCVKNVDSSTSTNMPRR